MKSPTSFTRSLENGRAVTNEPASSSNQVTTPARPASGIVLRGFRPMTATRAPGCCARSASASVGTRMRRPLLPDGRRPAVGHVRRRRIVHAVLVSASLRVPPAVEHDAVRSRIRAGADGCVPGAGHGVQVGKLGARKVGALIQQHAKPALPPVLEGHEVIRTHLVRDDDDEQLWLRCLCRLAAAGGRLPAAGQEHRKEQSSHRRPILAARHVS